MTAKPIKFAGHDFDLYPSGSLFLKEYKVLIVSDLHLEKQDAPDSLHFFAPAVDTGETLKTLSDCIEQLKPKKLILLGDIFHDADSFNRISLDNMDTLYALFKSCQTIWVEGHHRGDFSPPNVDMRIEYAYLNLNFRHIAADNEDFEISGHYHPSVAVSKDGGHIRRRCFICDKTKLIMPSFGGDDSSVDIHDPAIRTLFHSEPRVFPLGPEKVYRVRAERIVSPNVSYSA